MFSCAGLRRLCGLIVLAVFSTTVARADSLVLVTSQASQGANDSVLWSQLGADGTTLGSTAAATSTRGSSVTLSLAGSSSLVSVACTASPCSWTGAGFTAGDSLIWTSDTGNGGNGPLTLNFSRGVSGVGALIQADRPGQFTAQIQALNGATSLGSFTVASNANGDAAYIGVLDQSGANITSIVFSLMTCAGTCTDFAIDTVNLNTAPASLVSLVSSLSPSAFGHAVTFTATVKPASGSGIPTGTVTFNDGATALGTGTLSGGIATFMTSGLGAGAHSITALYGGDASFGGGASPVLTQTINKATSSTSVISSNSSSNRGAAVTFTATVTSSATGTPTGTVTFQEGAAALGTGTLSGGKATFTTLGLTAGTHSITAIYGGDASFAISTSPVLMQTMNNTANSTSVASSNNPSIFGATVTFTATVISSATGAPTGTVTFQDGAATLGTGMLSGGTATLSTSALAGGAHSITAVYAGDTNFASSTSPALIQTVADFSLSASPTSTTATAGSTSTYTITITPAGGFNQMISFQCGGAAMLTTCTAPASVSATGGSYAPFNVTVTTKASLLVPPGAVVSFPGSGSRVMLEWLMALAACGIFSCVAAPGRRSRGWLISSVAMLILIFCAGCATTQSGSNPAPNTATAPGTYTLTLTGTSGSLSHNTT